MSTSAAIFSAAGGNGIAGMGFKPSISGKCRNSSTGDITHCPPSLALARLCLPHPSIPRNPLISDPLFLAHYIERAGTGTLDMIALCRESGLPEPEFREEGGQFVMTLWRDWLSESVLTEFALNDRQMKAVLFVKTNARISSAVFQKIFGVAKRTAHRDLAALVRVGILARVGTTGKGTCFIPLTSDLSHKCATGEPPEPLVDGVNWLPHEHGHRS